MNISRFLAGLLIICCYPGFAQNSSSIPQRTVPDSIEMVLVKGDSFTMGGTTGNFDEQPVHVVRVKDFLIGKYEVTEAQWQSVMGTTPWFQACDSFSNPKYPARNVSWDKVVEFIKNLNVLTGKKYRLPTEAEWEFAARGGKKGRSLAYSGSDNLNEVAWFGGARVHAAGQKKPNELGIYDMCGNVAEWCSDWYFENYYSENVSDNPKGPARPPNPDFRTRVIRGGSWGARAAYCTVSFRFDLETHDGFNGLGFRLASDL